MVNKCAKKDTNTEEAASTTTSSSTTSTTKTEEASSTDVKAAANVEWVYDFSLELNWTLVAEVVCSNKHRKMGKIRFDLIWFHLWYRAKKPDTTKTEEPDKSSESTPAATLPEQPAQSAQSAAESALMYVFCYM